MKHFKINYLTLIGSFVMAVIFGWLISSIVVFFVVFGINAMFDRVAARQRTKSESWKYWLGQILSIALGCAIFILLRYLRHF